MKDGRLEGEKGREREGGGGWRRVEERRGGGEEGGREACLSASWSPRQGRLKGGLPSVQGWDVSPWSQGNGDG